MTKTLMFNPYTGKPRHPSDIASDPEGILIVEPGSPILAAPLSSYSQEDKDFYVFWYGHMESDMMQPPLVGCSHAQARYIWDAALRSVK